MGLDLTGNKLLSTSIGPKGEAIKQLPTDALILHLDAGNKNSYSGSGATWTDLSGNGYNATLINSVGYSSNSGGMLTFNGSTQVATVNVNSFVRNNTSYTFSTFFYLTTSNGGAPFCLMTTPNDNNNTDGFWHHLNLGNWLWRTEDNVSGEFGGNVEHANKVSFYIPQATSLNLPDDFKEHFNSNMIKEIMYCNKDMASGNIKINLEGIMELTFENENIKSTYYLVSKEI